MDSPPRSSRSIKTPYSPPLSHSPHTKHSFSPPLTHKQQSFSTSFSSSSPSTFSLFEERNTEDALISTHLAQPLVQALFNKMLHSQTELKDRALRMFALCSIPSLNFSNYPEKYVTNNVLVKLFHHESVNVDEGVRERELDSTPHNNHVNSSSSSATVISGSPSLSAWSTHHSVYSTDEDTTDLHSAMSTPLLSSTPKSVTLPTDSPTMSTSSPSTPLRTPEKRTRRVKRNGPVRKISNLDLTSSSFESVSETKTPPKRERLSPVLVPLSVTPLLRSVEELDLSHCTLITDEGACGARERECFSSELHCVRERELVCKGESLVCLPLHTCTGAECVFAENVITSLSRAIQVVEVYGMGVCVSGLLCIAECPELQLTTLALEGLFSVSAPIYAQMSRGSSLCTQGVTS